MTELLFWEEGDETLAEARERYFARLGKGLVCPCCDRWGKKNPRRLNSKMARGLQWLTEEWYVTQDWIDVPNECPRDLVKDNQVASNRWWGLIKRRPMLSTDPRGLKHSGFWMPTEKGLKFVSGQILVPKSVVVYKGEVLYHSKEHVNFQQALSGMGFYYPEAMEEVP